MKVDKRKKYYMVVDTETCPKIIMDEIKPFNMLVYNIAWAITDKKGHIYCSRSFIVEDIYYNESEKMKSAYYYNKMAQYNQAIKNDEIIVYKEEQLDIKYLVELR